MLDNVSYGPNAYAMHEENFAMENEYQNNYSSMQMAPPPYSKQQMAYSSGTHGAYPDGGWHMKAKYNNGWSRPNMHHNGYYSAHASGGGRYPGMTGPMMMAPAPRMSNNMMMSSEFEANYQGGGPGRMRMQNYGVHYDGYDDYANGVHNGHQKVEWKSL